MTGCPAAISSIKDSGLDIGYATLLCLRVEVMIADCRLPLREGVKTSDASFSGET